MIRIIDPANDVEYIGEDWVQLIPDFEVPLGKVFLADIGPSPCINGLATIWQPHYIIKDHLGNNRVVFSDLDKNEAVDATEIVQENHYYPFGLKHNDPDEYKLGGFDYLYNGKELQRSFDLNYYNYGARFYDASTGKFLHVDPLADEMPAWSTYSYTYNNPISFVDPDGRMGVHFSQQGPGDPPLGAIIGGTIKAGFLNAAAFVHKYTTPQDRAMRSLGLSHHFGVYEDPSSSTGVSVGHEIRSDQSFLNDAGNAALGAMDMAAIYPTSGVATFAKAPGMFGSDFIKNASAAFREAYSGGKHSGYLDNVLKTGANVDKSIRKKTRRINEHKSYINDLTLKYGDEWNTFDTGRKSREIGHWKGEIQGWSEQVDILNDLKKSGN